MSHPEGSESGRPKGNLFGIPIAGLHPQLPTVIWFRPETEKASDAFLDDLEKEELLRLWISDPGVDSGGFPVIFQVACRVQKQLPTHVFTTFADGSPLGDTALFGEYADDGVKDRLIELNTLLAQFYKIKETDPQGNEFFVDLPWGVAVRAAIGEERIYG